MTTRKDSLIFLAKGYDAQFTSAQGTLTGTRVYQLDDPAKFTVSAIYYDHRGRIVQQHSSNHLGGYDNEYFTYTFSGKVKQRMLVHSSTNNTTRVETYYYNYGNPATNPTERLLDLKHRLSPNTAQTTMAVYTYDETGRLKTKGLATETSTYSYNVRSWLTRIEGSKFNQTLAYDAPVNGLVPSTPLYNGNISAMKWKSGSETTERGYKFTYDNLNRLTAATYGEGVNITSNLNNYNEAMTYNDKMGNIRTLVRRGKLNSGYGEIDNLTYTYTGNRLTKVTDAVTTPITYQGAFHFVDGANVPEEYTYDTNGNITKDLNRNITSITYNELNLPKVITMSGNKSVTYGYDAAGRKLSAVYKSGTTITTSRDYVGNKVYNNGTLGMVLTEEGYATVSGTPVYYYHLKDHQGNNRVVISQSGAVQEVNHYYPFGGLFGEGVQPSIQRYKYNGKELDREFGLDMYDYGARHYDAALGRWFTVDPLAEKYYSFSPYVYVENNPVRFIDPDGMSIATFCSVEAITSLLVWARSEAASKKEESDGDKKKKRESSSETGKKQGTNTNSNADVLTPTIALPWYKKAADVISSNAAKIGPATIRMGGTLLFFLTLSGDTSPNQMRAEDSSKNEKHGDDGRALGKAEERIKDLKGQLEGATRKERERIEKKIRNINDTALKKRKGEEHSRGGK